VHIGEIKTDKPSITLIEFDARGVTETLLNPSKRPAATMPTARRCGSTYTGCMTRR
jgi:hypothetical protein